MVEIFLFQSLATESLITKENSLMIKQSRSSTIDKIIKSIKQKFKTVTRCRIGRQGRTEITMSN